MICWPSPHHKVAPSTLLPTLAPLPRVDDPSNTVCFETWLSVSRFEVLWVVFVFLCCFPQRSWMAIFFKLRRSTCRRGWVGCAGCTMWEARLHVSSSGRKAAGRAALGCKLCLESYQIWAKRFFLLVTLLQLPCGFREVFVQLPGPAMKSNARLDAQPPTAASPQHPQCTQCVTLGVM